MITKRALRAAAALCIAGIAHAETPDHILILVLDGLRPDYVSEDWTPNLKRLADQGVFCEWSHAVFPTVTRVNAPSIATGAYPSGHGLLGNSIYHPETDPNRVLSTSSADHLRRVQETERGRLLTAATLADWLDEHGKRVIVCSSGSAGSAYLLNPNVVGGGIINRDLILPESRRELVESVIGPTPEPAYPNNARNDWAVDAYVRIGLDEYKADVAFLWLTDPDHTAHAKGMGDPDMVASVRYVDGLVGRIREVHAERGLNATVIVTSDHGFSTHLGGGDAVRPLIEAGLKRSVASNDVLFAGGAIYIRDDGPDKSAAIVRVLQETEGVGALFTPAVEPGSIEGRVPGTLSFDFIGWNHARSADILVDADWSAAANEHGIRGSTTQGGVAGHGTASPWDIHNTLILAGAGIKRGVRSEVPAGNVDIAPTVCQLLGLPAPATMTGRVLREALAGGPDPESLDVIKETHEVATDDNAYRITAQTSTVDGHRYLFYAKATRNTQNGETR